MILLGNPADFAVEFDITSDWPPFGNVRLWLGGLYLGDIDEGMFLYSLWRTLYNMTMRDLAIPYVYEALESVPTYEDLLSRGGWSNGEAFDDFHHVYYAVLSHAFICFQWELSAHPFRTFSGYPLGIHRYTVPFQTFDPIVTDFGHIIGFNRFIKWS